MKNYCIIASWCNAWDFSVGAAVGPRQRVRAYGTAHHGAAQRCVCWLPTVFWARRQNRTFREDEWAPGKCPSMHGVCVTFSY